MPIPALLHRAGAWIIESGIQEPSGGVARYYRADIQDNKFISTEITGYAVSTLVDLHARLGTPELLDAARRAGAFLVRDAWDVEWQAFPCDVAASGAQPKPLTYFFDSGIVVRGLLALWRVTKEPRLLDTAVACGRAMQRDFAAGSPGEYYPILRLPEKTPVDRERRWSRSTACYQLKAAMAWHDLAEVTGDEAFRESYREVVAFALRTQQDFLPGSDDEYQVMDRLHPFAYFLEGLLPCASEPDAVNAMRSGIERASRLMREIAPRFLRADVVAQILRARLNAGALGVLSVDRLAAEWEASQLKEFVIKSSDARLNGGFWFGRRDGETVPHASLVPLGFGVQALAMWTDLCAGNAQVVREALV